MAATLFTDILAKGVRSGYLPGRTLAAREWYRQQAQGITTVNETKFLRDSKSSYKTRIVPGRMYSYLYDPKHKKTLPYYDRFPLIFGVGPAPGGFLGLNLHYLPPKLRGELMDALHTVASNKSYNESTKVKISYDILKKAGKFSLFQPCLKHYLTGHVRSKYVQIDPADWDTALFLPLARFKGASRTKIWSDSKRKM